MRQRGTTAAAAVVLLLILLEPLKAEQPSVKINLLRDDNTETQHEEILEADTAERLDGLGKVLIDFLGPAFSDKISSAINLVKLGLGLVPIIKSMWDQTFNGTDTNLNFGAYGPSADTQILAMYETLSQRLDQMERGVHGVETSIRDLARELQPTIRWEVMLDTLEQYTRPIETLYTRFRQYQKHKDQVEEHTLETFSQSLVSHDSHSVQSLMAYIHHMVAPQRARTFNMKARGDDPDSDISYNVAAEKVTRRYRRNEYHTRLARALLKKRFRRQQSKDGAYLRKSDLSLRPGIFQVLVEILEVQSLCHLKNSPQQIVQGLYTLVAVNEARAFIMINFAWMTLRLAQEGDFKFEQELAAKLYTQYVIDLQHEAARAMAILPNKYWRCDPKTQIAGDTYIQVTELMQGYIENEVDMNKDKTCKQRSCDSYEHTASEGCYLPDQKFCGKQRRCRGTIHNCKFVDADATVCESTNPYRRYDWIKYEDKTTFGRVNSCENHRTKVDSWWSWFVHCSYCFCLCDDDGAASSDRFFSLMPALADTAQRKVITGIKFVKHNRVIHIQVQEGETMPQGQIDGRTVSWVPLEPINIISTVDTEGVHYKKMDWTQREIDLDRLQAPNGHVITGVRFRNLGGHLNLEVQVTPVNFTSGELSANKSYWISNDNTPAMATNPRQEHTLNESDVPTESSLASEPDSSPDTYIRMQPTSMLKDASQTTVPFLDTQTVAPTPPVWLQGVGLGHKGREGFGGFLHFSVFTFNVTDYFEKVDPTL